MTVRVTEAQTFEEMTATPGAIRFHNGGGVERSGFTFSCPCGCKGHWGVRLKGQGAWQWNGSVENMTLMPSVDAKNRDGTSHWHGFVTDGEWRPC